MSIKLKSLKRTAVGVFLVPIFRLIFKRLFPLWQSLGFHITRNYFDEPIPDTRTLKDDLWLKKSELVGVNINEKAQINLLKDFMVRYKDEYEQFAPNRDESLKPYQYTLIMIALHLSMGKFYTAWFAALSPRG